VLVLARKVDESITIGSHITVTVLEIKGNQVRIGIQAPSSTPVNRTEICVRIAQQNKEASKTPQDPEQLKNMFEGGTPEGE
jgi:carbon storage regulator